MKKLTMLFLVMLCILVTVGCGKGPLEDAKLIQGVITEVEDKYITMYFETYGHPYGADCIVPLDVKKQEIDVTVGDEILVWYDGSFMESDPMQIGEVYKIELKDADSLKQIVEIRDRAREEGIPCDDAKELFFENEEYEYYFDCMKSQYIIVTYDDGSSEDVASAITNGNVRLGDLNNFGIEYRFEVKE